MRKGFASLALQAQEVLKRDPLGGHVFCFRGRRGDLLKVIWHDGQAASLYVRGWRRAGSCGRHLPMAWWRSRLRRWGICCQASTGATRSSADSDEAGHGFRFEPGHVFRPEVGQDSDLVSATLLL
jgi:hypothetical protein